MSNRIERRKGASAHNATDPLDEQAISTTRSANIRVEGNVLRD